MRLPTIEEINPANSYLDGSSAVETFYGKTLEEVEAMCCEGRALYASGLSQMGPKAFCFYFKAVISYVKSESSKEDISVAWLAATLGFQLEFQKDEIGSVLSDVKDLVKYVIENWSKFSSGDDGGKFCKHTWLKIRDDLDQKGNKHNFSLPCKPIVSESLITESGVEKGGSMRLPTIKEICPIPDFLDGMHAANKFYRRTLEEAEAIFSEALECHTEDLMWMGPKAFCFYLKAAISYVKGESSKEDDSVFWLSTPLGFKVEYEKDELGPFLSDVKDLVEYVIENWSKFTDDYSDDEYWKPKWLEIKTNLS